MDSNQNQLNDFALPFSMGSKDGPVKTWEFCQYVAVYPKLDKKYFYLMLK